MESLKKREDFSFVYQNGKSFANRFLVLYVYNRRRRYEEWDRSVHMPVSLKTAGPVINRVGISVSRKVGNSVVRHHLTRLVRENYRLHEQEFVGGLDLIVIVRPGAKESNFFDIGRALLSLATRAEIRNMTGERSRT